MMSGFRFGCALVFLSLAAVTAQGAAQEAGRLTRFEAYDDQSRIRIDFSGWSYILEDIVFDVGFSDRIPARSSGPQVTGTRLRAGSNSRYRFEANRVLFHMIDEERAEAISQIRSDYAALPERVSLASLNGNEQLAYWLNLHNVIVIDELIKAYPVRRLDQEFYTRPVVTIEGVPLSLNDIRFAIVQAGWEDPRVIYGFFSGAVGGPSLRSQAFEGALVWSQLERLAREYVNALRGVENRESALNVSELYDEHRALFPGWPQDLRAHLARFADEEVAAILSTTSGEPHFLQYDRTIADLTHGRLCGAPGVNSPVQSYSNDGRIRFNDGCDPFPPQARELVTTIQIKRLRMLRNGDIGRVVIRDLPSPEPVEEGTRPRGNDTGESPPR